MDHLKGSMSNDVCDGVEFCYNEGPNMSEDGKVLIESDDYESTSDGDNSVESEISDDDDDDDEAILENDQCVNNAKLKLKNVSVNDDSIKNYSKPKRKYQSQYSSTLNSQIVEKLEHDLDFYEKVSLVFLVYEDSQLEYALQCLTVAYKKTLKNQIVNDIISNWCLTEPEFWREKLLQALVVIKNFYVLSKLGYKKNDAIKLFHKKNYISRNRKKMYYFCESLSIEESKSLINKVNKDLKTKKIYNNNNIIDFDPKFLEISLLFWLSRKYIYFHSKGANLDNLISCLDNSKVFHDLKKRLENINKEFNQQKNKNKKPVEIPEFDKSNLKQTKSKIIESNDNLASVSSVSTVTTSSTISNNWSQESQWDLDCDYYRIINPNQIGLVIIINQKNFKKREQSEDLQKFLPKEELPDRDGTEADVNKIGNTFTRLGFEVVLFNDLIHNQVLNEITTTVNQKFQPEIHSSIFLFILTHGYLGHVYACNSIPIPIEVIKQRLWQCECLVGKPKGIIIQACQGSVPLEVVVPDGGPVVSRLHGQCDLFLGLATVSGHAAFRDPRKGTWFIQTLCKCIEEYADITDFVKIFTRVNDQISKKRASDATRTQIYTQVSECRSSLRAEWYLIPPKRAATL